MKTLDIHFPHSDFEALEKLRNFNIIYPNDHPVAERLNLDTLVQIVAWDDDEYDQIVNSDEGFPDTYEDAVNKLFLDVRYTRDCTVRYVSPPEWEVNWGPNTTSQWTKTWKKNQDQHVKIVCFVKPNYSLKSFNRGEYIDKNTILD